MYSKDSKVAVVCNRQVKSLLKPLRQHSQFVRCKNISQDLISCFNTGDVLGEVYTLDLSTMVWSAVQGSGPAPSPRASPCVASMANALLVLGGEDIDGGKGGHLQSGKDDFS